MSRDILSRVQELDDLAAVKLIRHVSPMLFKDPQIRRLLETSPPSARLPATLTNLSTLQKRETLTSERSIWLARALLAALASDPRFEEVLVQALESLRGDELVAEASVPRGLATEIVRLLASAREAEKVGVYYEKGVTVPVESAPDPLVDLALVALAPEGTPLPALDAGAQGKLPSARELCLNAWFPDQAGDVARLIVGVTARLCVNLGPPRAGTAGSEVLPGEVVQELCEVPFVDVLILCADADIKPLSRRLPMPPHPERVLEFTLIPLRPGELEIQILLLVHNEPIHRMRFPVTAAIRSDTATATTWSPA